MLGENNDIFHIGSSADDQAKVSVIRAESEEKYEQQLFLDASRRIVFNNCMNSCGLTDKDIPNFNRNFYYTQVREQNCLQDCYNTRMKLHFGSNAETLGALIDFRVMKRQYQDYEKWNPTNRLVSEYGSNHTDEQVESIA